MINVNNINLGLNMGVLSLLAFTIVIGGYYINDTHKSSQENGDTINNLENKQDAFIDRWEKRQTNITKNDNRTETHLIKLSELQNEQERQLIDISRNQTKIIKDQLLTNEKHILQNLTDHRVVSNVTRNEEIQRQNQTDQLIIQNQKTLQEVAKALNITKVVPRELNQTGIDLETILRLLNNRTS